MDKIEQLQRKIALLDQYATTLQRENLAKNRQTQTIYSELNNIRIENDVLRNHLSMLTKKQTQVIQQPNCEKVRTSINVETIMTNQQKVQNESNQSNIKKTEKIYETISCQTDSVDQNVIHSQCTKQIEKLTKIITQNQEKLTITSRQCNEMYESIQQLQNQLEQNISNMQNKDKKIKSQHQKLCLYEAQNNQLRKALQESLAEVQATSRQETSVVQYEQQLERLVRQNNQMIEKIRLLQKQKNSYYRELKSISPLKNTNFNVQKPVQQRQKFTQGKEKQRIKNERWKMIEGKINELKSQNQQIKANLSLY